MKKILTVIPTLLALSGCTGLIKNTTTFKYECAKLAKPFIDTSLEKKFESSQKVFIESEEKKPCSTNYKCLSMAKNERWKEMKLYLKGNELLYPKQEGFHTIYRDYSMTNCITNLFGDVGKNEFEINNKKFCLAEKINEDNNYNVIYKSSSIYIYNEENLKIRKQFYEIFVDNKLYIKTETVVFHSQTTYETCGNKNEPYIKMINNF